MQTPTVDPSRRPPTAIGTLLALSLSLVGAACANDASFICERRKECVASDLDVDRCVDQIEDFEDDSATAAGRVEDCANCLEGKSCSEAIGRCGSACFGVPGWT
jgi:hypothetical protein